MFFRRQQSLVFVLAVDIDQHPAHGAQHGDGGRTTIDAARTLPLGGNTPLDEPSAILIRLKAHFAKTGGRLLRNPGKEGGDMGLCAPSAHQIAADPLSQHCVNGVDDDGLTGAGFARQDIQAGIEDDIRLLDYGDIFNMQAHQHRGIRPFPGKFLIGGYESAFSVPSPVRPTGLRFS